MAKLANAIAVSPDADLDPQHFLGRLTMFTMPDEERNGAKVVRAWAKHGLDVDDLPEARQPVHVFQSACASVKARRSVDAAGRRTEITADEVHNNGGGCIYQITVKVWDRTNDVIEYEKALRVTFDKQTSLISFDQLEGSDPRLASIESAIQAHFDANAKTLPGQKIRNAIRHTLIKIGAQNLRRKAGGVYFVPTEWRPNGTMEPTKPVLDGLEAVLTDLYGDRADFYAIPLANSEGEQEMVRKHFTLNVQEKSQELMLKALQRVQGGRGERGVRSDFITNLYGERRRLAHAINQFDQLVSLEQTEIEQNIADLDEALGKLQELADENGS